MMMNPSNRPDMPKISAFRLETKDDEHGYLALDSVIDYKASLRSYTLE